MPAVFWLAGLNPTITELVQLGEAIVHRGVKGPLTPWTSRVRKAIEVEVPEDGARLSNRRVVMGLNHAGTDGLGRKYRDDY